MHVQEVVLFYLYRGAALSPCRCVAVCSNLSRSIIMLRQVIFATAPPRKNSWEFLRNKKQSHSVQANRFICLRLSVAHCDVVQGPGATELPEFLFFCFKRTACPAQGLMNSKSAAFVKDAESPGAIARNRVFKSTAFKSKCRPSLRAEPLYNFLAAIVQAMKSFYSTHGFHCKVNSQTSFPWFFIIVIRSETLSHTVAVLSFGCTPIIPGGAKKSLSM